jgi:DNA adenine methylase
MARIQALSSLTPFRYPGSKNKLLSDLMPYLDDILKGQHNFSDAFVGGGSVLLAIASQYPNLNLFANDKDYWVYCFWQVVANEDRTQLDTLLGMMETKPTIELFKRLREEKPTTDVDCAYRAIFFNRTTFSGIARSGPIGGEAQKSKWTVDCRYNFPKLKSKIEKCHQLLKGRTQVENDDITDYSYLLDTDQPVYLDPPYYIKGDMLYQVKMNDFHHNKMSDILSKRTHWVLSYDDCPEIRQLYKNNRVVDVSARYCIDGKKTDWKGKNELIILP